MTTASDTLGSRTGTTFRKILASQAKAYAGYGALLGELSEQKIEALDFARKSFDLYVAALGDIASGVADIGKDALGTGIDQSSTLVRSAEAKIKQVVSEADGKTPATRKAKPAAPSGAAKKAKPTT